LEPVEEGSGVLALFRRRVLVDREPRSAVDGDLSDVSLILPATENLQSSAVGLHDSSFEQELGHPRDERLEQERGLSDPSTHRGDL
jgi:hypothetical protein